MERSVNSSRHGVILLLVAALGYGSLVVLIKWAIAAGLNAETALTLRFTVAAAAWWLILLARRPKAWPGPRLAVKAMGIGALFYATNALFYYQGTARVTGSLAAMVVASVPVLVALLSWLLLGERLERRGWVALVLAVGGGVLLAGGPEGHADGVGLLWLGGAMLLYSLYIVVSTPLARAASSSVVIALVISGAAIFYWLWGGLSGRLDFGFDPAGWGAIISLALLPTVVAMFAFLAGAERVGATYAAIVNSLEPVVAVILTVLFLGDRPAPVQIVGGALVVVAAMLVQEKQE